MLKKNRLLILGASGYIGNYLLRRFKQENYNVCGTYFRNKQPGLLKFELGKTNLSALGLSFPSLRHVIFAAAANAKIDESKLYWEESYRSNVVGTIRAIEDCFRHGILPIYISSDGVFDGKKGNYKETDSPRPINCYGQMRFEVEQHILQSRRPAVIVRVGRVFGTDRNDGTLLTRMLHELRAKKKLFFTTDMRFTPVYIEDLFQFINFSIKQKLTGIFHIASLCPVSYYSIAQAMKKKFKLPATIFPCRLESLNLLEPRSKNTTLDVSRYLKLMGIKLKPLSYYLDLLR